jgi:hypothetical protein
MKVVGTGAPVMLTLHLESCEVEVLRDELHHRRAVMAEAAARAHELVQSVARSVRVSSPQVVEDACAFAWAKFMENQPDRDRPEIVHRWLAAWRQEAASRGLAVDDRDFIVPGTAPDGHFSLNQHKKWGSKYFRPAAEAVAREHPKLTHVSEATPYSARRGHITCRILAGEPVEVVARSCGTSPATIYRHDFVAIDAAESGHRLPPFEQQLVDAVGLDDHEPSSAAPSSRRR